MTVYNNYTGSISIHIIRTKFASHTKYPPNIITAYRNGEGAKRTELKSTRYFHTYVRLIQNVAMYYNMYIATVDACTELIPIFGNENKYRMQ